MSEEKDRIFEKIQSNPQLQILLKKISSGNADFKDTAQYADLFSKIMGSEFSKIVCELPDGMREQLCTELLRGSYENINKILAQAQTSLDEKRRIGIAPQKAEFPEERVQKIAGSLEDETVPEEVIKRRADTGTANVTRSFHDDYIKKNAEFRSNAGLKCYLERETDGNCCSWCSALAGRFLVGEHPADIFRRHDNCGCTVVLIDGKTRQYAWSKKTWSRKEEREYLKELDKKKKAKRLSREQAKALQEKNLPKSLTSGSDSGIIKPYKGNSIPIAESNEVSSETTEKIRRAAEKVTNDFPILKDHIKNINFGDTGEAVAINRFTPLTGENRITFSERAFSDSAHIRETLANDFRSGWSYDTNYIESLAAHEMGHAAHIALALKRMGLQCGKPLSTIECHIFEQEYRKITQEIYTAAFTTESFDEIQRSCAEQLGNMVYMNSQELIAQSFGNYYYGTNKSEIAKSIVEFFKKELR